MDSPYVRRVAIVLRLLGIAHAHEQLSVFRDMASFRAINPLLRAPTLVCDDGVTLVDSSLIVDYLEMVADPARRLVPHDAAARRDVLHNTGVALVACEKTVQRYYELALRPEASRHAPWLGRVTEQMLQAFDAMEAIVRERTAGAGWLHGAAPMHDDVACSVAWRFAVFIAGECAEASLDTARFPSLSGWSAWVEQSPAWRETPLE